MHMAVELKTAHRKEASAETQVRRLEKKQRKLNQGLVLSYIYVYIHYHVSKYGY